MTLCGGARSRAASPPPQLLPLPARRLRQRSSGSRKSPKKSTPFLRPPASSAAQQQPAAPPPWTLPAQSPRLSPQQGPRMSSSSSPSASRAPECARVLRHRTDFSPAPAETLGTGEGGDFSPVPRADAIRSKRRMRPPSRARLCTTMRSFPPVSRRE